jgi:hypothetical protein
MMLMRFKKWLKEVQDDAVAFKKDTAKDPALWRNVVWLAPRKNEAIKKKFRDELVNLGRDENDGKQVYFSRPSCVAKTSEWLYDFISYKKKENDLLEVFLAMEIEMSNPLECQNKHDFKKLLQADSRYKVFVFQKKSADEVTRSFDELVRAAEMYRFRSDSDFLLCGWCQSRNEFLFREYTAVRAYE